MSNNATTSAEIDIMNKSGFYQKSQKKESEHIFSNIYVLGAIFLLALSFIGYAIYYYMVNIGVPKIIASSSYYGENISNYQPLFQNTETNINDCITVCNTDLTCDGITYNTDTKICLGTKNGQIRNENANYSAWVKPPGSKVSNETLDFTKAIVVGYTKTMVVVNEKMLKNPYILGFYSYSFNITIYDFNKNYGSWRHIFHKGTKIETGTILNYQSWENLIVDFPTQTIGVWLAPFTNNLRIAVQTTSIANKSYGSYPDAFVQKCDSISNNCYVTDMPNGKWIDNSRSGDGSNPKTKLDTYIEFFDNDLQNIPLNTQVNITLNFRGQDAEIFYNGKIIKIVRFDGIPNQKKSNLYVMNDNTFGGEINNLIYYPDVLKLGDIQSIMNLKPPVSFT